MTWPGGPDDFCGSDEGSHYMSQTSTARLPESATCGGSKADAALERIAAALVRIAAEQQCETPLERAIQNNFGRDPYQIAPNTLGHRLRLSDASSFDVVCVCCGGTDRAGSATLEHPCASPLPAQPPAEHVADAETGWKPPSPRATDKMEQVIQKEPNYHLKWHKIGPSEEVANFGGGVLIRSLSIRSLSGSIAFIPDRWAAKRWVVRTEGDREIWTVEIGLAHHIMPSSRLTYLIENKATYRDQKLELAQDWVGIDDTLPDPIPLDPETKGK